MLNGFRQSRFHLERCQGEDQPIFFCKSPVGPLLLHPLDLSADVPINALLPRIREMTVTDGELLLIQAQQTAACNGLHGASSRICRWLLQTGDKTNSDIIPFTQEFLGQMLGVQRTTVSEAVSKLQAGGLIDSQYGQIQIVDRTGLKREACECYEVLRKHVDRLLG
jgi:hypothetical protein